jgi:hypothetical protein
MSEENKNAENVVPVSNPPETISNLDKMALELAIMNRKVSLAQAEKALAQNEASELSYKYMLLQMYMKYGLNTETDALDEKGNIHRGALKNKGQ